MQAIVRDAEPLSPAQIVMPGWLELSFVAAALATALLGTLLDIRVPPWLNVLAPALLSCGLAIGAATLVRRDFASVWLPLLWFRLAMIAYSGIGSMVPLFANEATLSQMNAFFELYPADMIRYNLLASLFVFILLAATALVAALGWQGTRRARLLIRPCSLGQAQFAIFCLVAGLPFKVLGWLPQFVDVSFTLPAFMSSIALLAPIGYALLASWSLQNRVRLLIPLTALVLFDFFVGVLEFNKSDALLPLILFLLGFLFNRPTFTRAIIVSGVVVFAYSAITPIVSFGRAQIELSRLDASHSVAKRLDALSKFATGEGNQNPDVEEFQGSWSRLAYISEGSFAMSQYDRGLPGNTLQDVFAVLIPRFLYPNKPEITRFSVEFNVLKSGNDQSQSLPGIPAEGYWDLGFPGVVLFAALMGVGLGLWSVYAIMVVRRRAWHLFFVSILGIHAAARIDGLFVADFEGSIALAIAAHYALTFLNGLLARPAARAPAAARASATATA